MIREFTIKLLEAMDEGVISTWTVAEMCLAYMSERDVKDMCQSNDLFILEEEEID